MGEVVPFVSRQEIEKRRYMERMNNFAVQKVLERRKKFKANGKKSRRA